MICNHWNLDKQGRVIQKSTACLEHNAQYLIDDLPYYIQAAASAGITGLLFGDYPWNQHFSSIQPVERVPNWQAVENYFFANTIDKISQKH